MISDYNTKLAGELHDQAQALHHEEKDDEAIEIYIKALELDPTRSETHYNLGLIYKYRNEWQLSLEHNQTASRLNPEDEASCWNMAIAATALRKWEVVRDAWSQRGIQLDGESGPIVMDFGPTPVRLNPDGDAEVVWGRRIDPVRVKINNIPYPESGFNFEDIVLHDGAAVGYRISNDKEYPVFNVLELFEKSNYQTLVATVEITEDAELDALEHLFSETKHEFEDWTNNVRVLCRQCSEGKPHESHDHELADVWQPERVLGIAVFGDEDIDDLLDQWEKTTRGKVISLEVYSED